MSREIGQNQPFPEQSSTFSETFKFFLSKTGISQVIYSDLIEIVLP
jgi:hypothetical protein